VKPKDKPKAAEKKPEKKKQEKLDLDQMEAFLNKIEGESTAPLESSQQNGTPTKGEANLQGTDNQLAATMIEALVQKIRQCWVVPPGAREAQIVVKVRFALNPDGTVIGIPEVRNGSGDPLFDATARSAVAAIMGCQAYDFLPQDQYDIWKDIIINFNPNMMFDS
jgi:TolA protein